MTDYIVLHMHEEMGENWKLLDPGDARVQANNAQDAIRKVASAAHIPQGTYVAIPRRSWKPVQVEAVQTTTLKLIS